MTSMDWVPGKATVLYQAGKYDAFPCVAYSPELGRTVATWRHASAHGFTPDGRMWVAAREDTDAEGVWSTTPRAATISGITLDDVTSLGAAGMTWSPSRKAFFAVLLRTRRMDSGGLAYTGVLVSSADGLAWKYVGEVPFDGASWFYVSHIIDYQDMLLVAAYGAKAGESAWSPMMVISFDAGASWSLPIPIGEWSGERKGLPAAEPRFAATPSGRLLATIRNEPYGTYLAEFVGSAWTTPRLIVPGVTGEPSMICITDDVWLLFTREYARRGAAADASHGATGWAFTTDAGETWTVAQGDPTVAADPSQPPGRPFMYGDFCRTKDGSIQAVLSVEDSKTQWRSAMVMSMRWKYAPLDVQLRFGRGAPAVTITTSDDSDLGEVTRSWVDPITGTTLAEVVRLRVGRGTQRAAWDYEAPQGVRVTYSLATGQEASFDVPTFPQAWLIHPVKPRLSVPIDIISHEPGDAEVPVEHIYIPGRRSADGRMRPVSVTAGHRQGDEGTIRVRTHTLPDAAAMDALLADGFPLLISGHVGLDVPRWVSIPKRSKARRIQFCGDEVREWTLSYVEVDRPETYDMPLDLRIRDLDYTYDESTGTIETGSPELLDL